MPRQKISLEFHKNKVLWILYNAIVEEIDDEYEIGDLNTKFKIPKSIIDLSVEELHEEGLCELREEEVWEEHPFTQQETPSKVKIVSITRLGIEIVNKWEDELNDSVVKSVLDDTSNYHYIRYFSTASSVVEPLSSEIPASDRYVTIQHNQQYQETLSSLDDAILQFKEDHHFDNELGQEKAALIFALEGGRKLLNDTKIWYPTAISSLIQPLTRIASKYKEAGIQGGVGAVINLALEQILSLFGLS